MPVRCRTFCFLQIITLLRDAALHGRSTAQRSSSCARAYGAFYDLILRAFSS